MKQLIGSHLRLFEALIFSIFCTVIEVKHLSGCALFEPFEI